MPTNGVKIETKEVRENNPDALNRFGYIQRARRNLPLGYRAMLKKLEHGKKSDDI
ncbi:MAG: hypothetical protein QOD99_1202 [Chthoniobacter sp.]|jgi:hypothetical protein|nr:hypothetical protein [Chthoniobacter sp.]